MSYQLRKNKPKNGRIMVRAAGAHFLNYHFGIPDLIDDEFDFAQDEIEQLKKQRQAPHLSDEYMDD